MKKLKTEKVDLGGTWMTQLVELLTLDFSWCHDLRVMESIPTFGSTLGMKSVWDSLPFSLLPHLCPSISLLKRKKKNWTWMSYKCICVYVNSSAIVNKR